MAHKIFVVEDHPIVREGINRVINDEADFKVCGQAASADKALKQIPKSKAEIVIVDLGLENSSGLDLIKGIRDKWPEKKVLVLTMYHEDLYAERTLQAGAMGYVMKDAEPEQIITALHLLIEGKTAFSERVRDRIMLDRSGNLKDSDSASLGRLSNRELQVYQLCGEGNSTDDIAEILKLSPKTIYSHMDRIKTKLRLRSTRELIQQAVKNHILETNF